MPGVVPQTYPQQQTGQYGGRMQTSTQTQTNKRVGNTQVQTNRQTAPMQMPGIHRDPNSGNVFQWRPEMSASNGGWSLMSAGQKDQGVDAQSAFWRAKGMLGAGTVPRITAPDRADGRAAEAAEFSRAKDRIGLATQGLLKSVGNVADQRGIGGSTIEGGMLSDALGGGQGQIADLIRQQAITSLDRDYDVEDRNYAGDLTQRGQDVSQAGSREQSILALMRLIQAGGGY